MREIHRIPKKFLLTFRYLVLYMCCLSFSYGQSEKYFTKVEESIARIAIATANGNLSELDQQLNTALDNGMTINQIKEELVHLYAYCGFPRSLMAINALTEVLEQRKAEGIKDEEGFAGNDLKSGDKYEIGKKVLAELTGVDDRPRAGYAKTVPIIEVFLKEHLFADIFKRGILTFKEREIATVAALVTLGDLDPMALGHMNITVKQGVSINQLTELLDMVATMEGPAKAYKGHLLLASISNEDPPTPVEALSNAADLIFPRGEALESPVFTGKAYLFNLVTADAVNTNAAGVVTFEPGARTFWHQHPTGQIIIALSGTGFYQEKGGQKQVLKKGDTVKCPADTPHWHGASDRDEFVQIAITGRSEGPTEWLEPVADEIYFGD